MITRLAIFITVMLVVVLPAELSAQRADTRLEFVSWRAAIAGSPTSLDSVTYKPRAWKKGAIIGGSVGMVLAIAALTTCDTDSNDDCPGWGRAGALVLVGTGVGALIGGLFPR